MEDSLEKIEREMREIKVGRGQVGYDAPTQADRAFAHFADRLRALRERDECYHSKNCRCFEHINEALNSGDGTYKP